MPAVRSKETSYLTAGAQRQTGAETSAADAAANAAAAAATVSFPFPLQASPEYALYAMSPVGAERSGAGGLPP